MALPKTVFQMVSNIDKFEKDSIVIKYYDESSDTIHSITYAQFKDDIQRCVSFLKSNIPGSQSHVAILARNSYHYLVNFYAVILADMVVVPLNTYKALDDLCYELTSADTDAIIHDGSYLFNIPELSNKTTLPMLNIEGYKECVPAAIKECDDNNKLAMIMFTSGTTAKSKGVMLSQKNMFGTISELNEMITIAKNIKNITEKQLSTFLVLPMFHIAAFVIFNIWICRGDMINLCGDMRYFYRDFEKLPSHHIVAVPVILESICKDIARGKKQFGSLKMIESGGANVSSADLDFLRQNGFFVAQVYGLTEVAGGAIGEHPDNAPRKESLGKVFSCFEGLLKDGELCLRGDSVMLGYYKDEAGTKEVIDEDGWFHTGDMAKIDEDGYVYLTGRKKNLIILSSGENINPEELENSLEECSLVKEVIVKEHNQNICAEVFCEEGNKNEIKDYIDNLNRTLPLYKRITEVQFRHEPFERTATGKIKRA